LSVAGILRIPLSQPPKRQLPVTVTAAGAVRALGVRLARSVACGSLPRLPHPHFASPGLAAQALIRAGKTSVT